MDRGVRGAAVPGRSIGGGTGVLPLRPAPRPSAPRRQIAVTAVGLQIPDAVDFGAWQRAGHRIAGGRLLGLVPGGLARVRRVQVRGAVPPASAPRSLDYQTLRNYAWVARRFPPARRRELLSFQHHAEVASLETDEQDGWLDLAETGRWSRNELRRRVRAHRLGRTTAAASGSAASGTAESGTAESASESASAVSAMPAVLRWPCLSAERVARWREAARRSGTDFGDWMAAALDQAAQ